jgi:hypothetical protein
VEADAVSVSALVREEESPVKAEATALASDADSDWIPEPTDSSN